MAEAQIHPLQIDLLGIATAAGASVRGAGMGPEALRVAGLAETLIELGHFITDHGDLRRPHPAPDAEPASWRLPEERQANVLDLAARASDHAKQILSTGHFPIFLGGDHSISMGTVSGVARHCAAMGKPIFVLWIDAHGDYNTPVTSPTGNLHGMSLALLCNEPEFDGPFACDWRGSVDPRNVAIFGARSIDREERRLLEARGVLVVDMRKIDELGAVATMRTIIERVRKAGGHLHVSLDVDAMDPSIAPGVGTTVPGGLTYREAHLAMEMLYDCGLVASLDIVELNPFLDEAGKSALLLVDLVASLFGRSIMSPPGEGPMAFVTEDEVEGETSNDAPKIRSEFEALRQVLAAGLPDYLDGDGILDVRELADAVGISFQAIYKWFERGISRKRVKALIQLSNETKKRHEQWQPLSRDDLWSFLSR